MATKNSTPAIQASIELFGEYPGDVITPLEYASETLGSLEEIFISIKQEAAASNDSRIKRLAAAGEFIASFAIDYIDERHRTMDDHLCAFMANSKPADIKEPSHV